MLELPSLTIDEVSKELSCPKDLIYKATRGQIPNAPILPSVKWGRRTLVRRDTLLYWLKKEKGANALEAAAKPAI